jgi:hypothetical protein
MPASTYEAISTFTLSNDTQFVTVSNIPQNYTDLIIVIDGISTNGTYIRAGFNNGTSVSYVDTLMGTSSPYTPSQFAGTGGFTGLAGGGSRNQIILNFQNYSSNIQNKTYIAETRQGIGSSYWSIAAGTIVSTAPITSFIYWGDSGNVMAGSTVSVYGLSANNLKATGGNIITTDGTYWYHAFTSSGVFIPVSTLSCDALVIAGGGGGTNGNWGGGSGAGGLRSITGVSVSSATTITVGAGGTPLTNGSDSTFTTITSSGGGYGGQNGGLANAGGSGGGASGYASAGAGAASSPVTSPVQGYAGGRSGYNGGNGGGGAGGAGSGSPSTPNEAGGNGGVGSSTFASWATATGTGIDGYYAGGGGGAGGGGSDTGGVGFPGIGGLGGGGTGANGGFKGGDGMRNTGGGAGGTWGGGAGATGGSGLVIVRYPV